MILIENNLRPMIRRNRKLFISMIIICMLGVMLMTAAVGSERSLRLSIERYIEEYQFQDITITTATAEQEDFSALNTIEGIDKIDLSYTEDVTFKRADGRILAGRLITRGADAFMRLDLVSEEEKSETATLLANILVNMICILNPEKILLGGNDVGECLSQIQELLKNSLPAHVIPPIGILEQEQHHYIKGLGKLGLQLLNQDIQIVRR